MPIIAPLGQHIYTSSRLYRLPPRRGRSRAPVALIRDMPVLRIEKVSVEGNDTTRTLSALASQFFRRPEGNFHFRSGSDRMISGLPPPLSFRI